jgi:eukaryotic-like serine/threonine-protein kinase
MGCPAPDTFSAFVSGQLAEPARDALELHVDSCDSCRMTLSELGRGAQRAVPVEDRIGRYAVSGELGAGAMGVVYLARDPELDRDVAIKLVHAKIGVPEDELVAQRVLREGRALARIDHANVVRVFDVGRSHGALFVAMERAPGVSLRAWLAEPHDRVQITHVFAQCARGLAAVHAAGIVHRDFKPDNVVVDERGHARVTDFGLAQTEAEAVEPATGDADVRVTRTRGVVGTPAYMAPEQHRGEPIDARADQYAWGIAFAEALTGKRPFAARTVDELLVEMRTPPMLEVPRRARGVIARALAFEPAARWPSMTAAAEALRPRRRWWPFAVAGLVVAIAAVLLLVRERRDACANVDGAIDQTWNPARATQLGKLFVASGKPFAERAWAYARTATDTYAGTWKVARVGVCRAGVERGEVDAAGRARIIACLERRAVELEAVLARWETAQVDALAAAPAMIDGLAPAAGCTVTDDVAAPAPLESRFAAARAAADAGQAREAEAQLAVLAGEAAAYPALRAEILIVLARAERDLGKQDIAREHFVAALAAAEAATADRARATALIGLAQSSVEDFARVAPARESLQLARAVLAKIGNPADLDHLHDAVTGLVELHANEPAKAIVALRRAIADDGPPTQRSCAARSASPTHRSARCSTRSAARSTSASSARSAARTRSGRSASARSRASSAHTSRPRR